MSSDEQVRAGEEADWPNCVIEGCPNKSCLALSSIYCFPHTKGNAHVKRWKIEARNAGRLSTKPVRAGAKQ